MYVAAFSSCYVVTVLSPLALAYEEQEEQQQTFQAEYDTFRDSNGADNAKIRLGIVLTSWRR